MKIKSYYSRTVEDAMAAARQEMGPEAMLVNSRKAPPEVRHLGEYEVVFGVVGAAGGPSEASLKLPGEPGESFPSAPAPLGARLSMEVADPKRQLECEAAITRPPTPVAMDRRFTGYIRRLCRAHRCGGVGGIGPEIVQSAGTA